MAFKKSVVGLLPSESSAETVVDALSNAGFPNGDISALFADRTGTRDFAHEKHTKAPEGAVAGIGAGGAIGGALGLLAGIGALAIPGLGPFIAAGPIMAALGGVAVGGAVGGITGALIGLGIPEIEAKAYEGKIAAGNVLVSVHVEDNEERDVAKKIFQRANATDVVTVGEEDVPSERRSAR